MPFPLLAIAAVGAFTQIGGSFIGGKAKSKEAKRQKKLADEQAEEILARAKINQDVAIQQGERLSAEQVSAFARGGVDVSSGSPLLAQMQTLTAAKRDAQLIGREARFTAERIKKAGKALVTSTRRANTANLAGSIAGGITGGLKAGA